MRIPGEDEALVAGLVLLAMDADVAEGLPDLALGRPTRRDLAGFGAAVDLDQLAAQGLLRLRRELRRQRRGGREDQVHRRQLDAGKQQGLQMERRGHERARLRHRGQRVRHVGREERPPAVERGTTEQRQQRRGLQAVAVLYGHRRHQRQAGERRAVQQARQAPDRRGDVADQRAPGLGVRLRRPGGTGGQQAHRVHVAIERRGGRVRRWIDRGALFEEDARETRRFDRSVIDHRECRIAHLMQTRERVGPRVGRQEAGLSAHQRRREADGESVAVHAQVHDRAAVAQLGRKASHVGKELARAHRDASAPCDRLVEITVRDQREEGFGYHRSVRFNAGRCH